MIDCGDKLVFYLMTKDDKCGKCCWNVGIIHDTASRLLGRDEPRDKPSHARGCLHVVWRDPNQSES